MCRHISKTHTASPFVVPFRAGWADAAAEDLPDKQVVRRTLFEGANREYLDSVSSGEFSYEPIFYGPTGWITIDAPEIITTPKTAPWGLDGGGEVPQCYQKTPLDLCVAEHAIKCEDANTAECTGDNPEQACLIAGAPVDPGASTAAASGYTGGNPGAWFNSFYESGDWGNGLLDPAQDPVELSACQFIPGDGSKGSSRCVAKDVATCEAFETTASRYNREGDSDDPSSTSNPDNLPDPRATCEALGPCVYRQASFPDYGDYKPLPGVTEAECLSDPDHGTNRFGHRECFFNFYWRSVFPECNDGELYGYRPHCYQCSIQAPQVPGCLAPSGMTSDECDADIRCENGYLRTDFDNSAAESRLFQHTLASGEILNSVDGWEMSSGIPDSPVETDWLTWAATVDKKAECEAYDYDGDGNPDGLYAVTTCTELAPIMGEGPWMQDNLVIPGFDPTAIDGIFIIAPGGACGQGANAGQRTLKVFNTETNVHDIYKFPGTVRPLPLLRAFVLRFGLNLSVLV